MNTVVAGAMPGRMAKLLAILSGSTKGSLLIFSPTWDK